MSDPDDALVWLGKAENDLLKIDNNLSAANVPWDTVCFHSQQAAEKLLKALLVLRGEIVPRTHDLSALLGRCQTAGFNVAPISEDCQRLQPYAVLTRYPGSPFEPDASEGHLAAEAARRVADTVRQMLGQSAT